MGREVRKVPSTWGHPKDAESLARWLANNKASAFGGRTATYEQWRAMIDSGSAPSMLYSPGAGLRSGVEAAPKKGV